MGERKKPWVRRSSRSPQGDGRVKYSHYYLASLRERLVLAAEIRGVSSTIVLEELLSGLPELEALQGLREMQERSKEEQLALMAELGLI